MNDHLRRFKVGDLVKIKKYCISGGQAGIIIKLRPIGCDIFMQSSKIIKALDANLELENAN